MKYGLKVDKQEQKGIRKGLEITSWNENCSLIYNGSACCLFHSSTIKLCPGAKRENENNCLVDSVQQTLAGKN